MVLRNVGRLTDVATLSNPTAQAARNAALRLALGFHAVRDRIAATMSETEIAYADSPLSVGRGAGQRLAPESYAGPPPGEGDAPRFALYAADAAKGAALAARYPGLLEADARAPWKPDRLLVVRPDGYVGLSAAATDWGLAQQYLEGLAA